MPEPNTTEPMIFEMPYKYEVLKPQLRKALPITLQDWQQLRDRLTKVPKPPQFVLRLGNGLVGASASGLLSAIVFSIQAADGKAAGWLVVLSWSYTILLATVAGLSLWFGSKVQELSHAAIEAIVSEMLGFEERFTKEDASITGSARPEGTPT